MPSIKEMKKELKKLEDEQFVEDLKAGSRRYKASGPLLITGVALIALSAGFAKKSDIIGAFIAAVGIVLVLAGAIYQGN
jgi:hypothetical protein